MTTITVQPTLLTQGEVTLPDAVRLRAAVSLANGKLPALGKRVAYFLERARTIGAELDAANAAPLIDYADSYRRARLRRDYEEALKQARHYSELLSSQLHALGA